MKRMLALRYRDQRRNAGPAINNDFQHRTLEAAVAVIDQQTVNKRRSSRGITFLVFGDVAIEPVEIHLEGEKTHV